MNFLRTHGATSKIFFLEFFLYSIYSISIRCRVNLKFWYFDKNGNRSEICRSGLNLKYTLSKCSTMGFWHLSKFWESAIEVLHHSLISLFLSSSFSFAAFAVFALFSLLFIPRTISGKKWHHKKRKMIFLNLKTDIIIIAVIQTVYLYES